MKLYQMIWSVVIILFFSSCNKDWFNQEPLKGIPSDLKEGVLESGPKQFSNFEDFIVSKMLRLRLSDQTGYTLRFKEGEESVYKIQLDLLDDFDSKYEILDFENPFSDLIGSEWVYDSKTQTGELKWTPARTFNRGEAYKKFDIQIYVKLRKRTHPLKNTIINVVKNLDFFVYKSIYNPEITAVRTKYNSYIKLDDGLFYKDTYINSLNLNHYSKIFIKNSIQKTSSYPAPGVEVKILIQDSIAKDPSSNSSVEVDNLLEISPNHVLNQDIFGITDERELEVPYSILYYIKRPFYELRESLNRSDCVSYEDEARCWVQLENIENLPINQEVYVKNYVAPKNLDIEKLYYKIDSAIECKAYDLLGYDYKIKDPIFRKSIEESQGQFCYLALNRVDAFKNQSVSEVHSIYLLEGKALKALDITKWEESYTKIPLFLKFQMSGHQPVQKINVSYMNQNNENTIFFKVKDENYFDSQPDLYFENIINKRIYSLLPLHFRFQSIAKLDVSTFEIELSFDVKNPQDYEEYYFQIAPNSGPITGESLSFEVSVLPSVLREMEYLYNPELDIVRKVDKINKKWIGTEINLETQLKRKYIFPESFYKNLNFENQILDIHSLKNQIIFNETTPSGELCDLEKNSSFLIDRSCYCSKENFYEDEEKNIYMESTCYYSASFQVLPSHLDNNSAYIQHGYKIENQSLSFPSIDLTDNNKNSKRTVSIKESSYLISETESEKKEEDRDNALELIKNEIKKKEVKLKTFLHLFFNLQPSWDCKNSSELDKKKCKIKYSINDRKIMSSSLNSSLIQPFLGEQIIADAKCFHADSREENIASNAINKEYKCDCEALRFLNNRIELDCDFYSDTLLEIRLKTDHPHIYFFNKKDEGNKQTSIKSIYI